MNELEDFDHRFRAALRAFPARLRPSLIRVLEMPDEERAAAIGELHRESFMPMMTELLIDLEEDRDCGAWS